MNSLFEKGNFQPINDTFIFESIEQLDELAHIQEKYHKGDMDTLLNELHDSIVGRYLGFQLINTEKHGFDCKLSDDNIFLESKVASYSSSSWAATFNDTTIEKANAFRNENVWLALSIWLNVTTPLCICFGRNQHIGDILEDGVNKHKHGLTVRSTQSISMKKLVFDFNFKILSISYPANILVQKLNLRLGYKNLDINHIIEYKNFTAITDY